MVGEVGLDGSIGGLRHGAGNRAVGVDQVQEPNMLLPEVAGSGSGAEVSHPWCVTPDGSEFTPFRPGGRSRVSHSTQVSRPTKANRRSDTRFILPA